MGKRKRLTALLCAVVMALTLLPVQAWATGETEGTRYRAWYDAVTGETHREALPEGTMLQPFPADEQSDIALFAEDEEPDIDPYFLEINEYLPRYGYSTLQSMGGDTLLQVYAQLLWIASNYLTDAYYLIDKATISTEEAELVTQAFYADWPEIFWARPVYTMPYEGAEVCDGVGFVYNEHAFSAAQLEQLESGETLDGKSALLAQNQTKFLDAASELIYGGKYPSGGDYDKELYLHDRLLAHVTYDDAYLNEQNAYTAIVEGKAVCAGYAFAFQYLLMRNGIESYYVVGTAGVDKAGKPVGHAWNIAKISGVWYYVDPTWDDSDDEYAPYHAYFNLDTDLLTRDHVLDPYPYNVTLPQCNELRWFYHRYNGTEVFAGDNDLASTIAIWINYYKGAAHLYMNDADPTYLGTWFAQNHQKVAEVMGITGPYRYGIAWCGPEYVLSLEAVSDDLNGDDSVDILDVQVLYAYLTTGVFSASDKPHTHQRPAIQAGRFYALVKRRGNWYNMENRSIPEKGDGGHETYSEASGGAAVRGGGGPGAAARPGVGPVVGKRLPHRVGDTGQSPVSGASDSRRQQRYVAAGRGRHVQLRHGGPGGGLHHPAVQGPGEHGLFLHRLSGGRSLPGADRRRGERRIQ